MLVPRNARLLLIYIENRIIFNSNQIVMIRF